MVDEGPWVGRGERSLLLVPGMDFFWGEVAQLFDPGADVGGVGVKFFLLGPGVKDPKVGLGVASGARDPLPIAVIDAGVIVGEVAGKELFPFSPVDVEVLYEKARDDHPDPIVHGACF